MPLAVETEKQDVVVIGGGPAGVCAAIAAARDGAETVLVEQLGVLGGMATAAMFQPWRGFHSFGKQLVTGIGDEIRKRLQAEGGSPGHLLDPSGISFTVTPFDWHKLKGILQQILKEENVGVMLNSQFVRVNKKGRHIESVLVRKGGREMVLGADTVVDATGTGVVAKNGGVRCVDHEVHASYRFLMENVDEEGVLEYARRNPHEFSGVVPAGSDQFFSVKGFSTLTKKWLEETPGLRRSDSIIIDGTVRKGEVVVSMISFKNVNVDDPDSIARANIRCQHLAPKAVKFLKDFCPSFSEAKIKETAIQPGLHASRQVCGTVVLSDSDVLSGRRFDDAVATCALPGSPENTFQVSRKSMIPSEIDNLLVTGRGIFPPTALFATNAQAASMQVGEAAGTIASEMSRHHMNNQ